MSVNVFSMKVILGDTIMRMPYYVVIRAMYRSITACRVKEDLNVVPAPGNQTHNIIKLLCSAPSGGREDGVFPMMAFTGRLCPKGVPFSGSRYMKGQGFYLLKYMKG